MNAFEREEVGTRSDDSESLDFFPPHYRVGRTKYIIVTGGVMFGVGKGVCTASLSHLLQQLGFSVTTMKIDGYLNVDAGTLNPYRHGKPSYWMTALSATSIWAPTNASSTPL